jgi:hypothetical protein
MANAKGTAFITAVKFLRSQGERARSVLPEYLHDYLKVRILRALWYPEEDLLELIRAMAKLLPNPEAEAYRIMGEFTAQDHIEGAYAHLGLAGATDPAAIPRKAFTLWASMHDTGRFSMKLEGDEEAQVELEDFAVPSREMCTVVGGYLAGALGIAGLDDVRVEKKSCRTRGATRCLWRARWVLPPKP